MENRKLFVGNIAWTATEAQVKEEFEKVGKVRQVRVPKDLGTGKQKGFAFVEMESMALASKAKNALHGQMFLGRELIVEFAKPSERRHAARK